jgi:hypothetical protein
MRLVRLYRRNERQAVSGEHLAFSQIKKLLTAEIATLAKKIAVSGLLCGLGVLGG